MKAFISYSHQDSKYVQNLKKHLAQVQRQGLIDTWYDREILAGSDFGSDIQKELDSAGLFLAIVSPDFISSDYCYEVEMAWALERHKAGEMRVVPIIVEPCEWKMTPLRDLKALPKDGKSVSEWSNANSAYLDVVTELRRALESSDQLAVPETTLAPSNQSTQEHTPITTFKVKRTFDAIDRDDFNRKSFIEICDFFSRSAAEINAVDGIKSRFEQYSDTSFGAKILNSQYQRGENAITVHMGGSSVGFGDIYYSNSERSEPNTANGWYSIEETDYELLYSGNRMNNLMSNDQFKGTANDLARDLWFDFVRQAGIEYG